MPRNLNTAEAQLRKPRGVRERSERALRLKSELNNILALVVHSRESLENELNSEFAQKKLSVDGAFVKRLKELTQCYGSLTSARIQLDKAEREMEREMTPGEEQEAVRAFIMEMDNTERGLFLRSLVNNHLETVSQTARKSAVWSKLDEELPIEEFAEEVDSE